MPKKKNKRVRRADSPVQWYLKQNQRWVRRIGIAVGLLAVVGAIFFFVDPFKGAPTAITATGEEVEAGVLERSGARPSAGARAPNFVLPDYDQKAVYLDQFEGKIVFVNFWASWCEFCEAEMPDIFRLAKRYPDDLVVLEVNRGESKGRAKGWSDGHNFEDLDNVFWILDERENVTDEYRVSGMPQSFFVGADGRVEHEIRQVTDFPELLEIFESILAVTDTQAVGG